MASLVEGSESEGWDGGWSAEGVSWATAKALSDALAVLDEASPRVVREDDMDFMACLPACGFEPVCSWLLRSLGRARTPSCRLCSPTVDLWNTRN